MLLGWQACQRRKQVFPHYLSIHLFIFYFVVGGGGRGWGGGGGGQNQV